MFNPTPWAVECYASTRVSICFSIFHVLLHPSKHARPAVAVAFAGFNVSCKAGVANPDQRARADLSWARRGSAVREPPALVIPSGRRSRAGSNSSGSTCVPTIVEDRFPAVPRGNPVPPGSTPLVYQVPPGRTSACDLVRRYRPFCHHCVVCAGIGDGLKTRAGGAAINIYLHRIVIGSQLRRCH